MKNDFMVQEMQHIVEVAKADLVMGMKQREAFVYKHKFGLFFLSFTLYAYTMHLSQASSFTEIECWLLFHEFQTLDVLILVKFMY